MKVIFLFSFVLLSFFANASHRVVTFNALVDLAVDKWWQKDVSLWMFRKEAFLNALEEQSPDLLSLQELLPYQLSAIEEKFKTFASVGARPFYDAVILFDKRKYELLDSGHVWISEDTQSPWQRSYGNFLPRILVWAKLRTLEEKKEFYFLGVHLDPNLKAQELMVSHLNQILNSIVKDKSIPLVFAGDFNIDARDELYKSFEKMGLRNANPSKESLTKSITYGKRMVDHIFYRGELSFQEWKVISNKVEPCRLISDHSGVLGVFSFNDNKTKEFHNVKPKRRYR